MDEKLLLEYMERGVTALEKLTEPEEIQVPVKPPICPHCQRMNPFVRAAESEATGALFEFVIMVQCLSCQETFYVIPEGFNCIADVDQVKAMMVERAELAGYEQHSREDQRTQT